MTLKAVPGGWINSSIGMLAELRESNWPKYGADKLPYGWAGEYSNANTIGFDAHFAKYNEIVDWIQDNIKRPHSNAHWSKIGDCIYVQIRKRKDWVWFTLRFGA